MDSEMNDPVIAFDSTRPRRMKICAMEKQSARLKRKIDIHEAAYLAVTTRTVPATVTERPEDDAPAERFNLTEKNTGPENGQ